MIGNQYRALDVRDNKLYYISKLADGKCWMTQNLDINIVSDVNHPYTSADTDLTVFGEDAYNTNNGYSMDNGVIRWVPSASTMGTSDIQSDGSVSHWTFTNDNPVSYDVGDWYWTDTYYVSTENNYLDTEHSGAGDKFSQSPYPLNGLHGHVGNYYNWSLAVASNDTSDYDTRGTIMGNSICPAGWRLPLLDEADDSKRDVMNLLVAYGERYWDNDVVVTGSPLWFVRGGRIGSGYNTNVAALGIAGDSGHYWAGVVDSNAIGRLLRFSSSWTFPDTNGGTGQRANNQSIRCLAR